jgi:putative heme-binding domain-containing protein
MRRASHLLLPLSLLVVLLPAGPTPGQPGMAPNVVPDGPQSPADERKGFHLPPGFEMQLVAADPDIHKPINLAFDDRGRLWLTDTVEYPYPAKDGKHPRDTVKILEDFGPDGRVRKITTFADGLNIPIGLLPLTKPKPQDALVYSIPNIYRFRDTNGTGHADSKNKQLSAALADLVGTSVDPRATTPMHLAWHSARLSSKRGGPEILYGTYGFRDTHGMTSAFTWGFDGWVYACHGFSNTSTVKGEDNKPITMQSGNTYRFRTDGSHLEQYTWGQVNPFGLAFDPLGYLYSADCHSQPVYQLIRGGYYPSFGKPNDGLGFAPEMFTGYKGSTAIAGIVSYAADQFPPLHQGTIFIGDVMTNEIIQFHLTWTGSSPKATPTTFLASKDRWFRPVDIKLGPDGALYIADFYNRIIGHYEVPLDHPGRDRERGRIWRLVYTGPHHQGTKAPRTDFTTAATNDLVSDLAHPNLTVRTKAANQLVDRGQEAVGPLNGVLADRRGPAHQRVHALWVLDRLKQLDLARLQRASKDDEAVRVHLEHILSERGTLTEEERSLAVADLQDESAHVRRAAADDLGRHPDARNVRPLLDLRHKVPGADTHLLHQVRMALRDQLRPPSTYEKLKAEKLSEADARALADVSLGVPSAESARFLLDHLRAYSYVGEQVKRFAQHIARHGGAEETRMLVGFCKGYHKDDLLLQMGLFRAVEKGSSERGAGLEDDTRKWGTELAEKGLASRESAQIQVGLELAELLKLASQQDRLVALLTAEKAPDAQRIGAMKALTAIDAAKHAPTLGRVLTGTRYPLPVREQAATALARANQAPTREELVKALPTVPARLQAAIAAALAGTKEGAEVLLDAVKAGKASARLLQERSVSVPLENTKLSGIKERVAKLTEGLPPPDAKVQELLNKRRDGFAAAKRDGGRGVKVFEKSCAVCHQVDGKGARIGPQLDGIGLRGVERLLEDILDPNRNVDQAFRVTTLTLTRGQIVQGLLLREEGAVLVLADSQGKEVRVPVKEVEERTVSQMSPMPANFAEQIGEPEFYDLLEFLLNQRTVRPEKK